MTVILRGWWLALVGIGTAGVFLPSIWTDSAPLLAPVQERANKAEVSLSKAPKFEPSRFDQDLAWKYLKEQVAFGPRNPGSSGHLKCRDYLLSHLKNFPGKAELQAFSHVWTRDQRPLKMWNIIWTHNWENAKTRVALYAHWDTRPSAEYDPDPAQRLKPILGANDGASGVAVLMALVNHVKEFPKDMGVMICLTDGEDLGPSLDEMFLGASHFAKNPPKPKPDYGILLDMIGDKDLRVPVELNSFRYAPDLMRALYRHARTVGLESTFPFELGQEILDDHIPLNQAGMKTIDLIDFTYPPWHTQADTVDKCSAESLGKVGKLLLTWFRDNPNAMNRY